MNECMFYQNFFLYNVCTDCGQLCTHTQYIHTHIYTQRMSLNFFFFQTKFVKRPSLSTTSTSKTPSKNLAMLPFEDRFSSDQQ